MAPLRKKRTPCKANAYVSKSPSNKNVQTPTRIHQRKRKLSDLLGPQWTKEELERFYKGYRKTGKQWAKVATLVGTRTSEMVEALFTMNQAYLSLPKTHASVAGLIAMMTDYYANLGDSDDEHKINGVQEAAKRPSKRLRAAEISGRGGVPSVYRTCSDSSDEDLLSFSKRWYVSKPWSMGKRTPRVPVSFLGQENGENRSSVRRGLNMNGCSVDDFLAKEIAMTFEKASQRGGSLHFYSVEQLTSISPVHKGEQAQDETTSSGFRGNYDDEAGRPNKKTPGKKIISLKVRSRPIGVDDSKEPRSGTEIQNLPANGIGTKSSKGIRRSKKVLFNNDKDASFQALEALADLSSRLPTTPGDHFASEPAEPSEQKTPLPAHTKDKCEAEDRSCRSRKRKRRHVDTNEGVLVASNVNDGNNNADPKRVELGKVLTAMATATATATATKEPFVPTKGRSRRKLSIPKMPLVETESFTERKPLANCLSWSGPRRWCSYEWLYSSIDYPWFAKREFVEYLDHVGLGHIPKLTQVEWGVIKSSLGKPRRFSDLFLMEEKEKLNQYRESVRNHYSNLRSGNLKGVPVDLPRPLSVGQRVIAIHPRTREPQNGCVLTVDHSQCRVQFNHPQLGVALVSDVNCMPLNPTECNPATVARVVKHVANECEPRGVKARSQKEADVHAVVELERALKKKEVVVAMLTWMNEEMTQSRNVSELMKKQYAAVILKLNEVNQQVSSALTGLRQRNTYRGMESAAHVVETVEALRAKAQSMVGATVGGKDDTGLAVDQRLIANCVAAFLMIQTCTERQFPPSDVAEVLDSAVSCLKPASSLNIPIYADIQKSMGIIKNQILGLLPS